MNALELPTGMLLSAPTAYLRIFSSLALLLLACCPSIASATPTGALLPRQSDGGSGGSSNGNNFFSNIWLPILIVAIVFAVLTMVICIRRCVFREARAGAANGTQPQPAGQAPTARPGRRRRPARTPSQISTKSLPPYMKEPGDHELVIFKGPSDMEDDHHDFMPVLQEDDEHPETGYHYPPHDLESRGTTLAENSITNLEHGASGDVSMRRSVDVASVATSGDSHESHSELLAAHSRQESAVPLEEAPPYFEVVGQDAAEISRGETPLPEAPIQNDSPGNRRSRFGFHNPFGSSSRHPPVSVYNRTVTPDYGSSLSLVSTNSGHRRNHGPSGSVSGLLKVFSEHPAPVTSHLNISVDSISAPLAYTLKRTEFRVPKGGLTPQQIKLITSKDTLEKFGAPYGPDAVAFSASRSDTVPPPDFEATIANSLGQATSMSSIDVGDLSSAGGSSSETSGSPAPDATAVGETVQTASGSAISGNFTLAAPEVEGDLQSSSLSPPSSYHPPLAESRASSVTSFATAVSELSSPATPLTARPVTPVTARPISR